MTSLGLSKSSTSEGLDAAVDGVSEQLDRWDVPGMSIAVVREGEVAYAGGVGRLSSSGPAEVTARSLFHHGSCCKGYTSLLACLLHADGLLDLDAPVRTWVPELQLPSEGTAAQVTLRDLLSHRSGLSRHDLTWILNSSWDTAELVRRLEHLPLSGGLREKWDYSNFGYVLAGLVIERAGGASWSEQLSTRVLTPAGMTRTITSTVQMYTDAGAAAPHLLRDGAAVVVAGRELLATAPAGALITSADDAARWLLLQLGAIDAIAAASVAQTHEVAVGLPAGVQPFPHLELAGYALGWLVARFHDRPMLYHSGGIDGFSTQTFLLPDQQIGVTISANLNASLLPMAAGLQLVDELLGTAENPSWYDVLHPLVAAALAAGAATDAASGGAPCRPIAELAGTYTDAGYGELILTADGERLRAQLGESELTARHLDGDNWELRYEPLDAPYPVTVESDADGRVSAVVAPFDPGSGPVRFVRQGHS